MAEKKYTCDCGGKTIKCYHPCNAGCCPNGKPGKIIQVGIDVGSSKGGRMSDNPASTKGYGFDTAFDGRIRGGIKTPDYLSSKQMGREFNVMDSRSTQNKPMLANRPNSNSSNSVNKPSMREGQVIRIHPLDIANAPRRIGATVFDPISQKWKVDDGRPRGIIYSGGKSVWGCWGKCKVKTWWGGTKVKCPCNKGATQSAGCECSGCMSGGAC